ncbi:unnamed protein product [Rotaria magnacalcarata]|uniref:TMC domain-containing protein n=1 Tax=Rotaria magnacalcarata TaxID=392030 RepID=A0A816JZ01_9BILA|nr:unnamed protein product [Rotaria magnacalcarata]
MEAEITETARHAQNLQNFVDQQHRKLLEDRPKKASAIYRATAEALSNEFDGDISKVIDYIQVKLDWSLSHRRLLLHEVQRDASDNQDKLDNIANFVFDPTINIKRNRRFGTFIPTISSVERLYGTGVCAIFHLQTAFFLVNLLTMVIWIALIIIPYNILKPSATSSNVTFSFSSIFTTKGYLSQSILFQGTYPRGIINEKYNLSLIYFVTTYIYFFIWFVFITIRFSTTYKRKVFNSILHTKLGIGFRGTFARYDYTIRSSNQKQKHTEALQRQFLDLIENDETIDRVLLKKFETPQYKFKIVITNLFYILLAIGLAYGQYIYMLLLADMFASLIFPIVFGSIIDLILNKTNRNFDGINLHVQLSPPVLLYSQLLIWFGIYFSPLLSIMVLLNIIFSFISHRLYIYIHSRRSDSYRRVFIWNGDHLEYLIYLLACLILILSVTCFVVFTTVVKPSENCGPFRQLSAAYQVIEFFLNEHQTSVLWISIINFITSPGFIYFLVATFIVIAYKLRHEALAEKQLVFIRDSNLANKKKLRENAVKKLNPQQKKKNTREEKTRTIPRTSAANEDIIDIERI